MSSQATIIPREDHIISRSEISEPALKVLRRLGQSGFDAYLVGGGVRDLLLGLRPKDFDIATNATPEEVNKLFKNSRLIGRRFKLVHVLFGREIIEVATFRASPSDQDNQDNLRTADSGMLLRDNIYGSIEEDALRRDFTINALYYSSKDFCVRDYAQGVQDLESKTIRLIGDANQRYREDPVRMLRALRFASKLNFTVSDETYSAIKPNADLLAGVSSARLFEEVLKLALSGHAVSVFQALFENELMPSLFPTLSDTYEEPDSVSYRFVQAALKNTDKRIKEEKPVTPAFLYASMLWPAVYAVWRQNMEAGLPVFPAMHEAGQLILLEQQHSTTIPKRFSLMIKEIWDFQIRLEAKNKRKAAHLIQQARFRAAYDFLLLREEAGEELGEAGAFWTEQQTLHPAPVRQHKHRPRRPRHKK